MKFINSSQDYNETISAHNLCSMRVIMSYLGTTSIIGDMELIRDYTSCINNNSNPVLKLKNYLVYNYIRGYIDTDSIEFAFSIINHSKYKPTNAKITDDGRIYLYSENVMYNTSPHGLFIRTKFGGRCTKTLLRHFNDIGRDPSSWTFWKEYILKEHKPVTLGVDGV